MTDEITTDYHYYNWVDRYNTLRLGNNTPLTNGIGSDSLLALNPSTGKFITLRVPYPILKSCSSVAIDLRNRL